MCPLIYPYSEFSIKGERWGLKGLIGVGNITPEIISPLSSSTSPV